MWLLYQASVCEGLTVTCAKADRVQDQQTFLLNRTCVLGLSGLQQLQTVRGSSSLLSSVCIVIVQDAL